MNLHLSGKCAWIAAFALLVLVNAIVLGGAYYNRSGEEARLLLSERELEIPYRWDRDSENTGIALRIDWRTPPYCDQGCPDLSVLGLDPEGISWVANWLDQAKMLELGFEHEADDAEGRQWVRAPSREVWVVLEFDGPQHQRAIQLAERDLQAKRAADAQSPGEEARRSAVEAAQLRLERERTQASRLFAIDAGLDAGTLRQRYAQRDRYLIVRAIVSPERHHFGKNHPLSGTLGGRIQRLSIDSVHVPLQFRQVFEGAQPTHYSDRPDVRYSVTLAYGRRFEPWIVEAVRLPSAKESNSVSTTEAEPTPPTPRNLD
jgi:hypothetical protein